MRVIQATVDAPLLPCRWYYVYRSHRGVVHASLIALDEDDGTPGYIGAVRTDTKARVMSHVQIDDATYWEHVGEWLPVNHPDAVRYVLVPEAPALKAQLDTAGRRFLKHR